MNETMQNLMRQATRLTRSGNLKEATLVIQRALGYAGGVPTPSPSTEAASPIILDGYVFEVDQAEVARARAPAADEAAPTSNPTGEFSTGSHTHASLTRHFKLYTPPGSLGKHPPLVVMLHGCTQSADDFAAGTGMNALAQAHGFCVLYPEQSASANPQRCWAWFKHNHQGRGKGEAALLASMTLSIVQQQGVDARRVYIAGLSAGGAMAAIVAAAHPEIFAAVGVHSGLAVGAAANVAEALSAMKSGAADRKLVSAGSALPLIVFHGDQDSTVHPRNGRQVSDQGIDALCAGSEPSEKSVEQGTSTLGRSFTRTCHQRDGVSFSELWVLHGAGHAWSGGSAKGSYTDPSGPDASAEMLRFFLSHAKKA